MNFIRYELDRVTGFCTTDTESIEGNNWDGRDRLFAPNTSPLPRLAASLKVNDNYFQQFLKKVFDPKLEEHRKKVTEMLFGKATTR